MSFRKEEKNQSKIVYKNILDGMLCVINLEKYLSLYVEG